MVVSSVPRACHSGVTVPDSLFSVPTSDLARPRVRVRYVEIRMYTCCVATLLVTCAVRTYSARQDAAEVTGLSAVYRRLQGLQTWHKGGERR